MMQGFCDATCDEYEVFVMILFRSVLGQCSFVLVWRGVGFRSKDD